MSTTARIMVVGDIAGEVSRKQVNSKDVAEFYINELALRVVAWETLASSVPNAGRLIVEGKVRTRTYTAQNQQRRTTEIIASTIEVISTSAPAPAPADDDLSDLPF